MGGSWSSPWTQCDDDVEYCVGGGVPSPGGCYHSAVPHAPNLLQCGAPVVCAAKRRTGQPLPLGLDKTEKLLFITAQERMEEKEADSDVPAECLEESVLGF